MSSLMDVKPANVPLAAKSGDPHDESKATTTVAADMNQELFVEGRDRLVSSIDASNEILEGLRKFNKDQWILRYPSASESSEVTSPLSVLRLDIKLGAAPKANTLVDSLEKSSVGQLLDERMSRSLQHLKSLRVRISDTQSKVLVTGDLNSGKSTFVNALMRRALVPTDQQPCTTVFCEIHDASRENHGVEEVHVIRDMNQYDVNDETTFTRRDLSELEQIFSEEEEATEDLPVLKCFCSNAREAEESLLHNGAVDIALIDAPGLNQDSVRTTAVFAREEEIDVVVFVVSAENHFTLSACEFLQNASNEKAYVFVVVNKYDQIVNKEKCRRRVLEQIRELSPRTYEEANELVHFVDARSMCESAEGDQAERFASLETNLHDFVLRRRAKSKLLPAKTYMERLLGDILFLVQLNENAAQEELAEARRELSKSRPALASCESNSVKAQRLVEGEEDKLVSSITQSTEETLVRALDTIGRGESAHASVALPTYPGLFRLWQYAQDVRSALLASLQAAVTECEGEARGATTDAVAHITQAGEAFLPPGTELPKRVFVPEAMFSKKPGMTALAGLGVNIEVVQVRMSDLFDIQHHVDMVIGATERHSKATEERSLASPSFTLGLGALSLVGSHALSIRSITEAFVRLTDILGSRAVRRWAGPALLVLGVGAVAWVVSDMRQAVPRNVGRNLRKELMTGTGVLTLPGHNGMLQRHSKNVFATMHGMRVNREVRKVLRLASWDIQEKFRIVITQRRADVQKAESQEKQAEMALEWLLQTASRCVSVQEEIPSTLEAATA